MQRLAGQLGALERKFALPPAALTAAAATAVGGAKEAGIDSVGMVPWQPSGVAHLPLDPVGSPGPVCHTYTMMRPSL